MKTRNENLVDYMQTESKKTTQNEHYSIKNFITVSEKEEKIYATDSPFGIGYTNDFEKFLNTNKATQKIFGGIVKRKISFVEAF